MRQKIVGGGGLAFQQMKVGQKEQGSEQMVVDGRWFDRRRRRRAVQKFSGVGNPMITESLSSPRSPTLPFFHAFSLSCASDYL